MQSSSLPRYHASTRSVFASASFSLFFVHCTQVLEEDPSVNRLVYPVLNNPDGARSIFVEITGRFDLALEINRIQSITQAHRDGSLPQ